MGIYRDRDGNYGVRHGQPSAMDFPEQKRSGKWDQLHDALRVASPVLLQPFVDVLRLLAPWEGVPSGTPVLYLGSGAGSAIVAAPRPGGGMQVLRVPAHLVDEWGEMVSSLHPDYSDFTQGYEVGAWESLNETPVSTRTMRRAPTWYGRGLVAGYRDRLSGASLVHGAEKRAWNQSLRHVRTFYPENWPARIPLLEERTV